MRARRSSFGWAWLLCATALMISAGALRAEERIALLIANADYPSEVGRLGAQPAQDAARIAAALKESGFKPENIILRRDLDRRSMLKEVSEFARRLRRGGPDVVGFFYYAGHGAAAGAGESRGDYLLPARASITTADQLLYYNEGVAVDGMVRQLRDAMAGAPKGVLFVVLDSCRNTLQTSYTRSANARGLGAPPNMSGLLISYAAPAGALTPNDGFFAEALAAEIRRPGQSALEAFSAVGRQVAQKSGGRPVLAPALNRKFCFNGCADQAIASVRAPKIETAGPSAAERAWRAVEKSGDVAEFELVAKLYPKSFWGKLAAERAARLRQAAKDADEAQTAKAAAEKAAEQRAAAQAAAQNKALEIVAVDAPQLDPVAPEAPPKEEVAKEPAAPARRSFAASLRAAGPRGAAECEGCPVMIAIPSGRFTMGSPKSEKGRQRSEGPQIDVRVPSFALARHEVTVAQYGRFMRATGRKTPRGCWTHDANAKWKNQANKNWASPGIPQKPSHPVVCVSWEDAQAYIAWLNDQVEGAPYRLPTEAEWEYAARVGSTAAYPWGAGSKKICSHANGADRAARRRFPSWTRTHKCDDGHAYTAPVGSFAPNALGVQDMIGNAWEWTADCWRSSHKGRPSDGAISRRSTDGRLCSKPVVRGGSWDDKASNLRSAYRVSIPRRQRNLVVGFRVARSLAVQPGLSGD